jgi:hypothetical protein
MSADKTPPSIDVWVCRECGYWRSEKSTGVHAYWPDSGPALTHVLGKARYIYLADVDETK